MFTEVRSELKTANKSEVFCSSRSPKNKCYESHEKAFAFLGGRTAEIVYDQDKILAVSENYGDIIYTEGFQSNLAMMKFKVYLCRGFDPESKGRVEAVVKFAKKHCGNHRTFIDIESFNADCIAWLRRKGNGMNAMKWNLIIQSIIPMVYWGMVAVGLTLFT